MSVFVTEFPVKPSIGKAEVLAQVVTWLKGSPHSRLFANGSESEVSDSFALMVSDLGEELKLREVYQAGQLIAVGFRYDSPDSEGRLWRTDGVLSFKEARNLISLTTECVAVAAGAQIDRPKRPYLIKMMLKDGWGDYDGGFQVSQYPHFIEDSDDSARIVSDLFVGNSSCSLPIVYLSRLNDDNIPFSKDELEKIAFELGGVCHVIVEPSRSFSFALRDLCQGRNVYGGAIGLIMPGHGAVRRYFYRPKADDFYEFMNGLKRAVEIARSRLPYVGYDWSDIQEFALVDQRRSAEETGASQAELLDLYVEEIENLTEKVKRLESTISNIKADIPESRIEDDLLSEDLVRSLGAQLYEGEFSDRLRCAVTLAKMSFEAQGVDKRTEFVLDEFMKFSRRSIGFEEFSAGLKKATSSNSRLSRNVSDFLSGYGFSEKSDNRHLKLSPPEEIRNVDGVVLAKTPSDGRAAANTRSQIENILGLVTIKKFS